MTVILDLNNYSSANAPPMRTSRATLDILQNHYPERLSRFIILNAPWLFFAFFKVISPFIDKVCVANVLPMCCYYAFFKVISPFIDKVTF